MSDTDDTEPISTLVPGLRVCQGLVQASVTLLLPWTPLDPSVDHVQLCSWKLPGPTVQGQQWP